MSNRRGSWRHLTSWLLDLVYPPRCAGCDTRGVWFCEQCVQQLARPQPPMCDLCGNPLSSSTRPGPRLCARCQAQRPLFDGLYFVAYFEGPLRRAIHQLKYQGCRAVAEPLGQLIAATGQENGLTGDLVIPVPLHARRQRERGYNQAALLARAVGQALDVPTYPTALIRQRATQSQVQLNARERQANVHGAFVTSPALPQLAGRAVLLIDDVCTTGATLNACAAVLRQAGAASVWALTVGRER